LVLGNAVLLAASLMGCTDYLLKSLDPLVGVPTDTSDTASSPVGDDPIEVEPSTPPCDGELSTEQWQVDFPARAGCTWDSGDNLPAMQGFFRAYEEQAQVYPVPEQSKVCDVRFEFSQDSGGLSFPFRYDDHMLFTFNDRVIFTTFRPLLDGLDEDALGYPIFNWFQMADTLMQFFVEPWAVGSDYTVDLPTSDVLGDAVLALDSQALADVTASALSVNTIDFQLYSFGDNDPTDCGHSGLSFWVEIDMAPTAE